MDISELPGLFGAVGVSGLEELSAGHINRTFRVSCAGGKSFILQSLNGSVFRDTRAVMENISAVGTALAGCTEVKIPRFLSCGGRNYAEADGAVWRMYPYIESCVCEQPLFEAGRAYGAFIRILSGAKPGLKPVIDGYHGFWRYYERFTELFSGRDVPASLKTLGSRLSAAFENVPARVIHGDAKPDNIIHGVPCTIIDLDTVMYGYAALDYGDLVRSVSGISAVKELTEGFAAGLDGLLSDDEISSLYYGILWAAGELVVRYLTDSAADERYFRGKTREQCRQRADELLRCLEHFISGEQLYTGIIKDAFCKKQRFI